jgi:glycosyltransferase involved in cell wall biosynthesis
MKEPKSQQPTVSIVLCTYNGDRFLKEQLESILNQDYKSIDEIVCVDDNSTDTTWLILKEYAEKYPTFKIFRNNINLGFIKNYEKAITLTTNQLIAISDQDDIWYSDKISKLVNKIENNLMVYSDNNYIDSAGKSVGIKFSDKRNLVATTSCLNFALFNAISGHTILFNRNLLQYALPFPTEIPYDFWLSFNAAQYSVIQVVNEVLVGYRQHRDNTIGALGVKLIEKKEPEFNILSDTQIRTRIFAKNIAPHLIKERLALELLTNSYIDKSFKMRLRRISLFWQNREDLLLFKKRGKLLKMIYCFKAFWKYD